MTNLLIGFCLFILWAFGLFMLWATYMFGNAMGYIAICFYCFFMIVIHQAIFGATKH